MPHYLTPSARVGARATTIPEFFEVEAQAALLPIEWPTPLASRVFRLLPTEAATVRVTPPPMSEVVVGCGALSEAMFRIAVMGERDILPWATAAHVARQLQYTVANPHPVAMRRAKKGWLLLASLAELGWVEISISAEPSTDDPMHFRRMPLVDRLRELVG